MAYIKETDDLDMWPAKFCLDTLLKKMAIIAPRLIYRKNEKNEIVETEIAYGLKRKFEDERAKRRNTLKLPPKLAGKNKGITLSLSLVYH